MSGESKGVTRLLVENLLSWKDRSSWLFGEVHVFQESLHWKEFTGIFSITCWFYRLMTCGTTNSWMLFPFFLSVYKNSKMKNYNSKREDLEEEDQGEDERNVIL
jgi:hypothetical protein